MEDFKILAISDIHGKEEAVKAFLADVRRRGIKADCLVVAGDIGCPESPSKGAKVMSLLSRLGLDIYYVKGNWDISLGNVEQHGAYDLDRTGPVRLGNYILIGHGERLEPRAAESDVLLVTHYPPYGILDRGFKYEPYYKGTHTGLIGINYLLERYRPILHIFGHSHKSGGVSLKLNGTTYVNVARLDRFIKGSLCIGNYSLVTVRGREVDVQHFYVNGVYKRCSRCNRKTLMPPSWNVCKECMMGDELSVEGIEKGVGRDLRVEIEEISSVRGGPLNKRSTNIELKLPLSTIRNSLILRELVEDLVRREAFRMLMTKHGLAFSVPRDLLTYLYPCPLNGSSGEPLIVRLFRCKRCRGMNKRACHIFKALLKYKAELFWGLDEVRGSGLIRRRNYALIATVEGNRGYDRSLIALVKSGFTVLKARVKS